MTPSYDEILVPTDGDPRTDEVLDHALALAELADARIHALCVVTDGGLGGDEAVESPEAAVEAVLDRAEERSIPTREVILEGRPSETILEYVEDGEIDMIVLGTAGRSGVNRVLHGSVAERVVRRSDVPVVTLRFDGEDRAVRTDEAAIEAASDALAAAGHELADVPDDPYQESSTWIVRTETAAGELYNVHVDARTGDTRLARIE